MSQCLIEQGRELPNVLAKIVFRLDQVSGATRPCRGTGRVGQARENYVAESRRLPGRHQQASLAMLDELVLSAADLDAIRWRNAARFFGLPLTSGERRVES